MNLFQHVDEQFVVLVLFLDRVGTRGNGEEHGQAEQAQPGVRENLERVERFLGLVALLSLFVLPAIYMLLGVRRLTPARPVDEMSLAQTTG